MFDRKTMGTAMDGMRMGMICEETGEELVDPAPGGPPPPPGPVPTRARPGSWAGED